MDEDRLRQIKERLEAATPGPWAARSRNGDTSPEAESDCLGWQIEGPPEPYLRGQFTRGLDAAFIAAAPTDIAELLAEVERLRGLANSVPRLEMQRDVARAQVASLKTMLPPGTVARFEGMLV